MNRTLTSLTCLLCAAALCGCATPSPRAQPDVVAEADEAEPADTSAPPAATPDENFIEREVTIGALRGTLTVPGGEGRWPTVLLIHDYGPMGRDGHVRAELGVELGVEVAVYRELAHALARGGFASVRWDKRTCVEGAGPRCSYPREFIEEAGGAIASALTRDASDVREWASARPEVDPERIGAIGHGEGSWIALALDARDPLWALALLAPTSHGLAEQIDHQLALSERYAREELAEAAPGSEADAWRVHADALTRARAEAEAGFEEVRQGGAPERVAGVARATWEDREALRVTAMARLGATTTPILLVHFPGDESAPPDTAARLTGVRRDAPTISIEGVTRGLIDLEGEEAEVSEALMLAIEAFMGASANR